MKEISLDKFKNSFALIADLVISLDEKNNAILKSRKEIEIYLKNKETFDKLHIVEELIYAYEAGAISESYLNNKEKDYWPKFTFERDCNRLMNSIKREIDRFQVNENDGRIQNLKEKIKALNTKSAKFNFLLEKKRNLEGDDPNWEILTNDKLYCWIKSELEYWEKFMEIPNGTVKQEPLPRLQTNLTNDRRASLFKLLSDSGFIPNTTDLDCFKWAIGVTDEKEPKQPGQWQPIQFLFDSK
ncbi:MAG TPA: hypothetical protein DCY97_11815, partial [Marinilabiliales bacterium]|nr:hypothetical protein [Marinilabiliales bacterium]